MGLGRDEQRLGDLAVGQAFGGEPRDAQLGGGERIAAGDRVPPRLGARGDELGTGGLGDSSGATVVG